MKTEPNILTQKLKDSGYKFLGWQNGWHHIITAKGAEYTKEEYPEFRNCMDSGHPRDHVQHNPRGSENTVSCDICKIYYKYDCSD